MRPPRVQITYVCPLDSQGRKPDAGTTEASKCFAPGVVPQRHAKGEAESKEELDELVAANKGEGVFVEFAIADEATFIADKGVEEIQTDLALGRAGRGVMRNDLNPARQDPLLIIDPITFLATGEPSTDMTDLHRPGGCADTSCIAEDGEHNQRAIYNWEEPRIRNANDLTPQEGTEGDSSSLPWWIVVIIAAGVCCCLAILLFVIARRRNKRVTFNEFQKQMEGSELPYAGKTVQQGDGGEYVSLKEQEMDDLESRSPTGPRLMGDESPKRRFSSDTSTTTIISAAAVQQQLPPISPRLRQVSAQDQSSDAALALPARPVRRASAQPSQIRRPSQPLLPPHFPKQRSASTRASISETSDELLKMAASANPPVADSLVKPETPTASNSRVRNASKGSYAGGRALGEQQAMSRHTSRMAASRFVEAGVI